MRTGQQVRLRATSKAASFWNIPPDAVGTVICAYHLLKAAAAHAERLDVRFTPRVVVWGLPATEFEQVSEPAELGSS